MKSEHRLASPELGEILRERSKKSADLLECMAKREESACEVEEAREAVESFAEQHKAMLEKRNGHLNLATAEARQIQRQMQWLQQEQRQADARLKQAENVKQAAQRVLDRTLAKLAEVEGPFLRDVRMQLDKLKLKRCAYHGGALLGNDVHTILQAKNFHLLLEALKLKKSSFLPGPQRSFEVLSKSSHSFQ